MKAGIINLPSCAVLALETLEKHGYEAWCVGGCVRDSLRGLSPIDWDMTTNALPEEIKACFQGYKTADTGMKHGTVTVLLPDGQIEVTTYRRDGKYLDHRHPEQVAFSKSLQEDLSRRDFTVNALAYHPARGLVDCFGGLEDLKNGVLRCVGDASRRFEEDALRVLRCLRFAAALGFIIEEDTAKALEDKRNLLGAVSHERVREEMTKLLCGRDAAKILGAYSEVAFVVLPELAPAACCGQENPYHCCTVWEHTLKVLSSLPPDPVLRWAALLHDCGKPGSKTFGSDGTAHFYGHEKLSADLARSILERLRFPNRESQQILDLVRYHGEIYPMTPKRLKKLLGLLGEEQVFRLFQLSEGDLRGQAPFLYRERIESIRQTEVLAKEILAQGQCLTLRDLKIDGNDLLGLGYEKGPSLGKALKQLLDEVLEGSLANERAALLGRAEELLPSHQP